MSDAYGGICCVYMLAACSARSVCINFQIVRVDGNLYLIADVRNDFYSSANNTNGIVQQYSLTSQYKFTASNWITLGGTYMGVLNEVRSKSYGIEETIGENEWIWSFTPTIRASFSKNDDRFQASLYGYNINPNTSLMRPVMNISDPSRPGLGNIYLKPSTQSYFYTTWTRNDKKRFSTLMLYLSGSFTTHPTSYAQWYDAGGILYSIPVNAVKPSMNASAIELLLPPLRALPLITTILLMGFPLS